MVLKVARVQKFLDWTMRDYIVVLTLSLTA